MRIDKLSNIVSVSNIGSSAKGNRVFLDTPVDTFVKSNSSQVKDKKTILEKIKEKITVFGEIKKKETVSTLEKSAEELAQIYKTNVSQIKGEFTKAFGDMESVESISARSKGKNSIFSKLLSKFDKGKLTSTEMNDLVKGIGDGYGVRIVLKDIDPAVARNAINASNMTYEDFIKNVKNMDNLDPATYKQVKRGLNKLKEAQTGEFVNKFVKQIKKGAIDLADDEFNNYGSDITSYFSDSQLMKIALAYEERNKKPLTVVNKLDLNSLLKKGENINPKPAFVETNPAKATKVSGYTTTQANLKTKYTMGEKLADTELQVRGKHVNDFAEIEHVPYDIRQNKITDPKYNEIKNVMRGMSDDSYKEYSKYLSDTYTYHRLNELGVHTAKPELSKTLKWADVDKLPEDLKNVVKAGEKIDESLLSKISEEGLLSLH